MSNADEYLQFLKLWEQWNILYQKIFGFVKKDSKFAIRVNNRLWKDKNTGSIDAFWEHMHQSAKEATMLLVKEQKLPEADTKELQALFDKIKEIIKREP